MIVSYILNIASSIRKVNDEESERESKFYIQGLL